MASCLLAFGSNIGDTRQTIVGAVEELKAVDALRVVAQSVIHTTRAIGGTAGQQDFANAVAVVETLLPPIELLRELQAMERQFGRQRDSRWNARTLDIDLLLIGEQCIDVPDLRVPHVRMSFRPFVLDPAVEIAADWRHPHLQATLAELRTRLHHGDDTVLLYGGTLSGRQWHADRLVAEFEGLQVREHSDRLLLLRDDESGTDAPKLAIQLQNATAPVQVGLPTLSIPATAREEVAFDTIAAVECIWPDLCRRA